MVVNGEDKMGHSQNGWSVVERSGVQPLVVHGVSFPQGVRKGDVAIVLGYFAERWHDRVNPLDKGECWGYDKRQIRGSSTWSNHASASALDFDAPDHPQHKRGSFTAAQLAGIRDVQREVLGTVKWGGDFSGNSVDEMHVEISGNADDVRLAALAVQHIRAGKPLGLPVLKLGSHGSAVRRLQATMNLAVAGHDVKVDGEMGAATVAIVKYVQGRFGIKQDGEVGPITWAKVAGTNK